MADVTILTESQRKPDSSRRGQLLLVAGLLLAVTFVLLAVLLNSVIYAENLGSRGASVGGGDVIEFETSLHDASEETIRRLNRDADPSDPHSDLTDEFEAVIDEWDGQARQHGLRDGDYSTVSVDTIETGTQIEQSGGSFENDDGDGDWELAQNDVRVRSFEMEIDTIAESDPDDAFRLVVSDGTDVWEMAVYDSGVQAQQNGVEIEDCETTNPEAIDFATATVDGEFCEAVIFGGDLEAPYDSISYENGSEIEGGYRFIVDDTSLAGSNDFETHPGIYSSNVTLEYENHRIDYKSTTWIAPEEPYD
ncbi:DUF7261 family protein [Natrarchaeobius chitinivorans]|uniref:Uncharacterized protein n=1 Tax=Natrarchaeobius chitinivorans TaxID=1679083 RepID=A0A3N6M249_NATCH|nr:hypothetical protein [Natrarchaeobius chitinivorans]RQG95837.1 hypothetical protein EA473_06515 [Natrarchaeobius chitinivorans]